MTLPTAAPAPPADPVPKPSIAALFTGFLALGMMGFGGVLPLARIIVVEKRRWLTEQEFIELLGLCQFLPGGNIINLSVAIGLRFQGVRGAIAAMTGLLLVPAMVAIMLAALYERYQDDATIRHLFSGLSAAAAGLLVAMAVKLVWPLRRTALAMAFVLACVLAIDGLRLPLLPTLLVLAPFSILATGWAEARRRDP